MLNQWRSEVDTLYEASLNMTVEVLLNELLSMESETLHLYFTLASVIINMLLPPCLDWSVAG